MKSMRGVHCKAQDLSRPTRGAWIEMSASHARMRASMSRPTRGAWIEIALSDLQYFAFWSRPTRGAWIEIHHGGQRGKFFDCRAPRGARGLKLLPMSHIRFDDESRPTRGAWIEMHHIMTIIPYILVAPHAGRVD